MSRGDSCKLPKLLLPAPTPLPPPPPRLLPPPLPPTLPPRTPLPLPDALLAAAGGLPSAASLLPLLRWARLLVEVAAPDTCAAVGTPPTPPPPPPLILPPPTVVAWPPTPTASLPPSALLFLPPPPLPPLLFAPPEAPPEAADALCGCSLPFASFASFAPSPTSEWSCLLRLPPTSAPLLAPRVLSPLPPDALAFPMIRARVSA